MEGYATDDNEKDSMLFGRGVCEKINILAKISPAFITSLLFRVRLKFDKNNSLLIISCTLGWFSHHFVHHPARLHSSLCKLWYPLHFWNAQVYVWRLGYCFLLLSDKCTCSDCSYQWQKKVHIPQSSCSHHLLDVLQRLFTSLNTHLVLCWAF